MLVVTGCTAGTPRPLTPSIAGVQVYRGLSNRHLTKGQYPQVYPQSPPVGGPHSPAWLKCGVYDRQVPKENAVHSLEHGAVWITYQPELTAAQVSVVVALANAHREYVLVSPYSGQDAAVIATAWGLQLRVQSPDDPRLAEFVRTYAGGNQGGEQGSGCTNGATLAQAEEYDASAR